MNSDSRIYVAGHTGLVGSALVNALKSRGYTNIVGKTIEELDLRNPMAVKIFFEQEKPEYVILAAAKVGGIVANNTYRGEFIYDNLMIQNNIIHQSYLSGVKKLLFLGSSCIYPRDCPQPIKEEFLLTSILEYTNEPYAIAKIAGIKMCESYNIQYGTNFLSVMPTNLYGINDNFDLEKSHVLPALIRKMHLGKCLYKSDWNLIRKDLNKNPIEGVTGNETEKNILDILCKYGITIKKKVSIELWGTGNPRREFLHADDMADACVFIMEKIDFGNLIRINEVDSDEIRNTHINIGTGVDISIRELANIVQRIVGYKGEIVWNTLKPDGTMKKQLDVKKLHQLGWKERNHLIDGIGFVYEDYQN